MGKISLNKTVFDSTLNHAHSANAELKEMKSINVSLSKTDLKSVKEQLKVLKDFENTLSLYSELLTMDLKKLQNIGDDMVRKDEAIGNHLKMHGV
ncbi:hypothetical protein [Fictibacillus gelatini]|uniref:hypothetical protein n=1 Tax=Fictibacillus gelatini TaxID=225985 RepID=UPI0004230D83|nr:hypothetical protein [Fictibacillus gelatini]